MMLKSKIWYCTLVSACLVLKTVVVCTKPYDFKCPSQTSWKFRAQVGCNKTINYFCLFNNVAGRYVEGCNGPDWDRTGSKRIYVGDFSRGKCIQNRFQPFIFRTDGGMADCVYRKSFCGDEGQIVYRDNSTKDDRSCRCDYTNSYAFINNPRHMCFCIPTEEDCSCYIKSCPVNLTLSSDYSCIQRGIKKEPNCIKIKKFNKTLEEKSNKKDTSVNITASNFNFRTSVFVLSCLFITLGTGAFLLSISFDKWTCGKQQTSVKFSLRNHTDRGGKINGVTHKPIKNVELTTDEANYLRMVHLLFRVACPVVRMAFNYEIHPNKLRKSLDEKKAFLEKMYRKKEKIINDFQWGLLFRRVKGQTHRVTSDEFDIRLMILLFSTLANIEVGDLYPVYSDTRTGAMLSRIKFISNETLRNFEGKLSRNKFDKYWDDIGQAILKLGSSHKLDIKNEQEKTRMIDRLLVLSPITVDNKTLRIFIYLSEIYPTMLLQQLINEYCTLNSLTIETLLRREKHQLYHKRIKTISCCKCSSEFQTFYKVIHEKQWKAFYENNGENALNSCPSNLKQCCDRFVPKMMHSLDISMSRVLILNIPDILTYMVQRLCINGIDHFLKQNQHLIYHSMEDKRCCKCSDRPAKKKLITKGEWNKLFKLEDDTIYCQFGNKNCCCQYSVRNGIKFTDIDGLCLSKIFTIAGPIAVLNNIEHDALIYFLNWTVDDEPLQRALTNLLNMIEDKMFSVSISSFETTAKQSDACRWIARHLRKQEATTEQQIQILIQDEDGLSVRSVLIPEYFQIPFKRKKLEDLTKEENNYLVVVHGLTKIVYPIIKHEFNTQCPDHVLDEIRFGINDKQLKIAKSSRRDRKGNRKKGIHLTPDHQRQLFSQTREESKNLDLELMIYILKKRSNYEWNRVYIDQLTVIDNVRREIVQSSSGTLNQTKFHDIVNRISKVVLHFGGRSFKEELSRLQHIRNILD